MKKLSLALILTACLAAETSASADSPLPWPAMLPVYSHIVIVVEENKEYGEIIDNPSAPFINNILRREGANFTRAYAEEHFSEGNYFWLFSGDNQTVGFVDVIPDERNHPAYPFTTPNLGASLIGSGRTFKGYSEDLPYIGYTGEARGAYARKHVPWISFGNLPNGKSEATSVNLRFSDFPSGPDGFDSLPTVAIVVPNQNNDMHNGPNHLSIPAGDTWLQQHLGDYYQWAKSHNSLLIVTFDETDDRRGYLGLTNPLVNPDACIERGSFHQYCADIQNRIVTIFAGAHIKQGDYPEAPGITHVNILRTIEAMYGLPRSGRQQPNAAGSGIRDDFLITDIFEPVPGPGTH